MDIKTERFDVVEVYGRKALFTDLKVDRDDMPDGIYCYDIRHTDYDDAIPCSFEEYVLVNRFGTVLCSTDFGVHGRNSYIEMDYDTSPKFWGEIMTLDEYRALPEKSDEPLPKVIELAHTEPCWRESDDGMEP